MRDMTHSCAIFWLCKYDLTQYILQVALVYTSCEFIRAPWRIHMILVCMWLMTPIYVLYSAFVYTPCELICDPWRIHMRLVHMWHMIDLCVFCIPHLCTHHANWYVSTTYAYATYLYVTHDRFICVLYSVFVYTHPAKSCLSREVFICDAWLIHMCFTGRTCVSSTQIRKTWRGVCE